MCVIIVVVDLCVMDGGCSTTPEHPRWLCPVSVDHSNSKKTKQSSRPQHAKQQERNYDIDRCQLTKYQNKNKNKIMNFLQFAF